MIECICAVSMQVHAKLKQIIESLSGIIMAQSSQNFVGQKEVALLHNMPSEQHIVLLNDVSQVQDAVHSIALLLTNW